MRSTRRSRSPCSLIGRRPRSGGNWSATAGLPATPTAAPGSLRGCTPACTVGGAPATDASPARPPTKTGPLGLFNLIGLRPAIAADRRQVGHLEGDLITGSFNQSAIVTVSDRASRYLWLADLPEGHGTDPVLAALVELLDRVPVSLRRTLTWDQGSEMARHATLAQFTGIDVYFAEPHSPWQRPTNESGNGLLRRYVGKGTDLSVDTTTDLDLQRDTDPDQPALANWSHRGSPSKPHHPAGLNPTRWSPGGRNEVGVSLVR